MPSARGDQALAELLSDVGDVDLDDLGEALIVLVAEMLVEPRARHDLAPVQGKNLEERVLSSRQSDRPAALADGA